MKELNFERTVWAERQLAKMCPNNDINRLEEVLSVDDFDQQMGAIERMIVIMNEAAERKAHFLDNSHEMDVVTIEYLDNLKETELMELSNLAFASFYEDAKGEIETTPKKEKAE